MAMRQREQALALKDVLLSNLTKAHSSGTGRRVKAKLSATWKRDCSNMLGNGLSTSFPVAVVRSLWQVAASVNATMDSLREFWTELNSLESLFCSDGPARRT